MPLLRRKPFNRIKPPSDLRAEEEVFHCTLTNEIFRDYEQFYERIILCNSLVWSCALTGKPNLTYAEAKDSEKAAKELMQNYSKKMHIPTLYIASLAQRTSFLDLVEDVWGFCKDRYFMNEELEANIDEGLVDCRVSKVIYSYHDSSTPSKSPNKTKGMAVTDPCNYQYEIYSPEEHFEGKKIVDASVLRRIKTRYSREKQRLFLRANTETGSGGIVRVKEYAVRKYRLNNVTFSSIFAGPEPNFQQSKRAQKMMNQQQLSQAEKEQKKRELRNQRRKEKRAKLKEEKVMAEQQQNAQSSPRKRNSETNNRSPLKNGNVPLKSPKSGSKPSSKGSKKEAVKKLTPEQLKELKLEKARQEKEAEKQRKLEERLKARKKAKEEKRRLDEFYKEWSKAREDLLCEDLRELPQPCMVQCRIPNHLFGDFIAVLEFLTNFKDTLRVHDIFPKGLTFEMLERALVEKEVAGPMSELLQLLLENIFTMQEEEEAEVKIAAADLDDKVELGVGETGGTLEEAVREATRAASWSQTFQGCSMGKLTLDSTTLSEVLRLHLYSSGGRCNEVNSAWRYQQRGGYTLLDDPGLMLRMSDPQILRALKYKTVIELSIEEKLKIVTCLIHQILMFASVRDIVSERAEKLKKAKCDLKSLQSAEKRRELEEVIWRKDIDKKSKEGEPSAEGEAPTPPQITLEEAEAEKQKREKESAKKKADFLSKEHKLQAEVTALEWSVSAAPLGSDRAYRRYWIFQSLPGIFVEHNDDYVGPCLENGTPSSKIQLCDDPLDYIKHLFVAHQSGRGASEEASSSSSDKENERSPHVKAKPALVTAPVRVDDEDDEVSSNNNLFLCTGETDLCPVHSTVLPRVHWSFLNRPEELDRLLASLNPRGFREGDLKQSLTTLRPSLESTMLRCPAHLLGRPEDEEKVEVVEARRSARQTQVNRTQLDANLNFPPGTPMNTILESTLRDLILDIEDKIHLGGLGILKVESREAWRESIEREEYDSQCDRLIWGGGTHPQQEFMGPTDKLLNKIKSEDRAASRPDTPDSLESGPTFQDPVSGEVAAGDEVNASVHAMACALLQVEQALESRYITEPLGESEKERQKRQKKLLAASVSGFVEEPQEEEKERKAQKCLLERWEQSLMASTSFSQLYVHFYTLENSIMWAKSALNARCRVCRRKGDGEKMLLCDGCDKGHHTYCLKPELKSVPVGEWFCPSCKPREVPPTPRKNRRNFTEESESEESEDDEDGDGQDQASEGEQEESMEAEEEEEENCASCNETGDLVKCEECNASWHPECAKPRLRVVPRTAWTCQDCRDAAATRSKAPKRHGAVVLAQKSVGSRRSAREASSKITKAAKRLRSNSWDDTDSSRAASGTDEPSGSSREQRNRRRPRWLAIECEDPDLPLNAGLLGVLLTDVMNHAESWPFLRPVLKSEAPDYHQIIKRPMDFGTIKYKLNSMCYRTNSEFLADSLLVFENCEMYNHSTAEEYKAGEKLKKFFERKCQELGLKIQEEDLEAPEAKRPRRPI